MAVFCSEISLLVTGHADVPTLKCLRLASRTVDSLISRLFGVKAFPYANIQISDHGLTRPHDVRKSVLIALLIWNIGINTQVRRQSTMSDMRKELRSCLKQIRNVS
jgi:hypothetical protein